MKILFVDSSLPINSRSENPKKLFPSIGIAYVSSYAKKLGHDVKVYDVLYKQRLNLSLSNIVDTFQPEVVAFGTTTPFAKETYNLINYTKRLLPSAIIVLGGPHASVLSPKCLIECKDIDYIIVGEGEIAFSKLLSKLDQIRYDHNNKHLKNQVGKLRKDKISHHPISKNLDDLPFPDWSLYDYNIYDLDYSERFKKSKQIYPILHSRGCTSNCKFCYNIFGKTYRVRSSDNVLQEIEYLHRTFTADFFDFIDPTMTLHKSKFIGLCNKIIKSGLSEKISWKFETRVDCIDEEVLESAKRSGAEKVLYGIESADNTILSKMEKGIKLTQIKDAISLASALDIKIQAGLIIGFPYETPYSIQKTIDFCREMKARYNNIQFIVGFLGVYPGTEVYKMVNNGEGNSNWIKGVKENWDLYFRNAPMIEVGKLNKSKLIKYYEEIKGIA